jgi:hypothetical protein
MEDAEIHSRPVWKTSPEVLWITIRPPNVPLIKALTRWLGSDT